MSGSSSSLALSLGVVKLIWGGTSIDTDAKRTSFNPGGTVYTPVVAGTKISQSASTVPPKLSAAFPLLQGMSIAALKALNGTEMQVECDTGQTYISASAYFQGDPKVTGGSGSNVSAEWSGLPFNEVLS